MAPCLIAPPESEAPRARNRAGGELEWAQVEERRFAGGEFTLRPLVAVGNRDVLRRANASRRRRRPRSRIVWCVCCFSSPLCAMQVRVRG